MERHFALVETAQKKLKIADHMLTMTYPFVKDPKILLSVLENIFLSFANSMAAVLYYERTYKRIPSFQDNFSSKFNMFKQKCAPKLGFDQEFITTIQNIKELMVHHKKSPIEFSRKDSFVICTDNYDIKTITLETIKNYLTRAKLFNDLTSKIVK